jgi:hypothetical protein
MIATLPAPRRLPQRAPRVRQLATGLTGASERAALVTTNPGARQTVRTRDRALVHV